LKLWRKQLKNFPRIDPKLIEELEKMYPPIQFDPDVPTEQFMKMLAQNAGQVSVIDKLKQILKAQDKTRGGF
tara:strand:- start:78 stop:293 length:216 start_codon:yes stop_codon:yes gene_type:complete